MGELRPQGIVQHADGTWSIIGSDGWPMDITELALTADDMAALEGFVCEVIDVEPISVEDHEII